MFDAVSELGRVFITGGADWKVRAHVQRAIVGGDVTVQVEKEGKRYSVNGQDFRAKSEAEELELGIPAGICRQALGP